MQDEEIAGNDIIMIPLTPVKPLVTNGVKNRGIPFYEYKYWYIHKEKSVKFDTCWHIFLCGGYIYSKTCLIHLHPCNLFHCMWKTLSNRSINVLCDTDFHSNLISMCFRLHILTPCLFWLKISLPQAWLIRQISLYKKNFHTHQCSAIRFTMKVYLL